MGRVFGLAATLGLVTACTTAEPAEPATLANSDEVTLSRLKSTLAEVLGRQDIRLGAGDLTEETTITVLPPPPGPLETHSTAVPIPFDIVTDGKACFVVRRETGETFRVKGISCEPITTADTEGPSPTDEAA